jgi:hypothetical protein
MSAPYGLSRSLANVLAGAIESWKIMASGDAAYYSLGELFDGTVEATSLGQKTGLQQERGYAFRVEAKAKLLGTSKAGLLQLLSVLSTAILTHKIKQFNGQYVLGEMGFGWKFDASKDYEGNRFLEVLADRIVIAQSTTITDWDDIMNGAAPADGVSAGGDILNALAPGSGLPSGCSAFEIRNTGEVNWETLGEFRNANIALAMTVRKDSQGMTRCAGAVSVVVEADMMQTSSERAKLDSILTGAPDFRVTLADGTILTFADQLGCGLRYSLPSSAEDSAFTRISGGGAVKLSDLATIIS